MLRDNSGLNIRVARVTRAIILTVRYNMRHLHKEFFMEIIKRITSTLFNIDRPMSHHYIEFISLGLVSREWNQWIGELKSFIQSLPCGIEYIHGYELSLFKQQRVLILPSRRTLFNTTMIEHLIIGLH